MSTDILKVPKIKQKVSLWVHPEGQVIGSVFVEEKNQENDGPEEIAHVLNREQPFIVLQKDKPEELRFYNRNSIIRVEYPADCAVPEDATQLSCTINMMDGSVFDGTIREDLPPDYSRLFDYINKEHARFIRLFLSDDEICLINKSYIVSITTKD